MTTETSERTGPVFVVGMNGSGTTMILDHLGQHPGLYAFPAETYVLPHYLQSASSYGDLQRDSDFLRLWNDMRSCYVFRRRNSGKAVDLPDDWRDMPRTAASVFDRIMREFAARECKSRWAEKTPMHVLHILRLAQAFEGSTFIHMIRDGRDCAASDHRRWGRHPVATIYRWKNAVREGRRQGEAIGDRYLELRYERVTEDPERHLKVACEFAGLDPDRSVYTTKREHRHSASAHVRTIVSNRDRNTGYFSERQMRLLERVAGKQLAELGYATRNPDGDMSAAFLTRLWWTLHDGCRVATRHLRMKATKQGRMTMSLMWRRWRDIVQSKLSNIRSGAE